MLRGRRRLAPEPGEPSMTCREPSAERSSLRSKARKRSGRGDAETKASRLYIAQLVDDTFNRFSKRSGNREERAVPLERPRRWADLGRSSGAATIDEGETFRRVRAFSLRSAGVAPGLPQGRGQHCIWPARPRPSFGQALRRIAHTSVEMAEVKAARPSSSIGSMIIMARLPATMFHICSAVGQRKFHCRRCEEVSGPGAAIVARALHMSGRMGRPDNGRSGPRLPKSRGAGRSSGRSAGSKHRASGSRGGLRSGRGR